MIYLLTLIKIFKGGPEGPPHKRRELIIMIFKKFDFVSIADNFENLLKTAKADFEYYDRKANFYDRLLDKIKPIENNLPDDEKTIDRYYELYERIYDNYAKASALRDQLERYVLKLERLYDEMMFFYECN